MPGKSTAFKNAHLLHVFNNADIALIGDAAGLLASAADGSLYVGLHTADPAAGDQTTSEATYTSYARIAIARTSGGWTVAANNASNAALTQWPTATGGSDSITYWSIGTAVSGTGSLLYSGARTGGALAVSSGIRPEAAIGDLDVTED